MMPLPNKKKYQELQVRKDLAMNRLKEDAKMSESHLKTAGKDLQKHATELVREHPGIAVAAAAGAGFLLTRSSVRNSLSSLVTVGVGVAARRSLPLVLSQLKDIVAAQNSDSDATPHGMAPVATNHNGSTETQDEPVTRDRGL